MQSSCQFAVAAKLDVDFFVEREPHKVERFRHLWREYALVKCRDGSRRRARMSVSTRGRGAVQRHLGRLSLPFFHPYRVCSCTPLRREPTLNLTHSLFFFSGCGIPQLTCRDAGSWPPQCCPRRSSSAGAALWQCPQCIDALQVGSTRRVNPQFHSSRSRTGKQKRQNIRTGHKGT